MGYVHNEGALAPLLASLRLKRLCVVVALGDSNTCNASFAAGHKHWPELVHTEMRIHFVTQRILLVNAGICGDTTAGGLARLETDVLRFSPSLVMLAFGSNDSGRCSPTEFRQNMDRLVDHIMESGSLLLLRTSPPVMELEPTPPHIWRNDPKNWAMMDVVRDIAAARGLPLVDHHLWWRELEDEGKLHIAELMHDCVHPNHLGHQLLARQVGAAFGMPDKLHWERGEGEAEGA